MCMQQSRQGPIHRSQQCGRSGSQKRDDVLPLRSVPPLRKRQMECVRTESAGSPYRNLSGTHMGMASTMHADQHTLVRGAKAKSHHRVAVNAVCRPHASAHRTLHKQYGMAVLFALPTGTV